MSTTDTSISYERLELLPQHVAQIIASGISPEVAAARGYESATKPEDLLEFAEYQRRLPALKVRIHPVAGDPHWVARPDNPRSGSQKYECPERSHISLDAHPMIRERLTDPTVPLIVTEGPKKSDAAISRGICCVSVQGVWSFRVPGWDRIALKGRPVYICYDSDQSANFEVRQAMLALKKFLSRRGATVRIILMPTGPGGEKCGLDDYLLGHTPEELFALVGEPEEIPGSINGYTLTDYGNGRRLVDQHGDDIRYVYVSNHKLGTWYSWNGTAWAPDSGEVARRAKATVVEIYSEAAVIRDDKARAALIDHARASESEHRLAAMMASACTEPEVRASVETFDADPWILNCANGALDLRTGKLRPHERGDYITKVAPIAYDPNTECELWLAFLDRIMGGNQNLIRFLKRLVGSSLAGVVRENALFILWGSGSNGKSTFLETWRRVLGKYALQLDPSTLSAKGEDRIPNDLARLPGVRLASLPEMKKRGRLNEPLVKRLTGRDTITARFLHKEFFDFIPACRIVLCTNHKPDIQGTDYAIWRRIHLVPFGVTIPKGEQDTELTEKLAADLPGILRWAVAGCIEWQMDGIGSTEEIDAATAAYRAEQDVPGRFFSECTVFEEGAEISAAGLSEEYRRWADERSEKYALSGNEMAERLREQGCVRSRPRVGGKQVRGWRGVRLLRDGEEPEYTSTPEHTDSKVSPYARAHEENPENGVTRGTQYSPGLTVVVEEVLLETVSPATATLDLKVMRTAKAAEL